MSNLASIFTATKALSGDPSITGTDNPDSGSLLDSAISLFGKGVDVYTAVKGTPTTAAPSGLVTQKAPTATAPTWKTYLPWILGGAGVLLLLYFVARKG